LYRAVKR